MERDVSPGSGRSGGVTNMCKYCEKQIDLKVMPTSFLQAKGFYDKLNAFIHKSN